MSTSRIGIVLIGILLLATGAAQADWEAGVAAFKSGNYDQAANEFRAVVDGQPDWPGGHYMLGQTLLKQNKNQDALGHLRKAYDLNPNDVSYQLVLGKAYLSVGRYGDAAQLLAGINASSLPKGQQAAMLQMLGVAYDKTGDSDRALQAFSQAAQANPNDADIQYQLGSAALNAGDTATSVRALGKAASLDAGDSQKQEAYIKALIRSGRENRGDAKTKAYQQAVTTAKSLAASQNTYENLLLLGEAQLGATDYAGAAVTLQQAAAKKPNEWLPLYYVGQAHTATGRYNDAVSALTTALGKAGSSGDKVRINKQLGFVYEKKKDFGRAKAAYAAAGDTAAVTRVEGNEQIQAFNEDVDEEAQKLRAIEEEARRLEEELKQLPGGAPPPGP